MPTWRKLHTKATESLDINAMPDDFHRLLWVMLPLGLDREGRGIDNPSWVKAKIMPLRTDITPDDISAAMAWFTERDMIRRYEVDGRNYFYVPTFKTYQGNTSRESKSTYPAPPAELTQSSRNGHVKVTQSSCLDVDVDVDSDVDVDVDASSAAKAAPQQQPASQAVVFCRELYGSTAFSEDDFALLRATEKADGLSKVQAALQWSHGKQITEMKTICNTAHRWVLRSNGHGSSTGPPGGQSPVDEMMELVRREAEANGNARGSGKNPNRAPGSFSKF